LTTAESVLVFAGQSATLRADLGVDPSQIVFIGYPIETVLVRVEGGPGSDGIEQRLRRAAKRQERRETEAERKARERAEKERLEQEAERQRKKRIEREKAYQDYL